MKSVPPIFAILLGMTMASAAHADFLEGFGAFQSGNYCKAREEWQGPARKGDASAAFGMAELYARGLCIKEDQRRASEWYLTAALRGFARARSELGIRYAYGKGVKPDLVRSYLWLSAARMTTATWDISARKAIDANLAVIAPMVSTEEKLRADSILARFSKDYKMPSEFEKLD